MKYHQLSYRKRQRILHLNWGDLAGLHKRVATPPPNPRKKKYRTGYNKFLCYLNLKIITCVCQYILLIYFLWGKKPSPTPNINTHGSRIQGFSKLVFFVWFVWFFFLYWLIVEIFQGRPCHRYFKIWPYGRDKITIDIFCCIAYRFKVLFYHSPKNHK